MSLAAQIHAAVDRIAQEIKTIQSARLDKRLVGEITSWMGNSAQVPPGWLLCDGTVKLRADYPDLFAVIGTTYNTGGETSLQFRLPDLKGRVPVGLDASQVEFDTLGEKGGAKTHTLTVSEMPSHKHNSTYKQNASNFGDQAPAGSGGTGANNATDFFAGSAGGDQPHNNLQPYITVKYLIRFAAMVQADGETPFVDPGVERRPVGELIGWTGTGTPPTGWLDADGTTKKKTDWPELFAFCGTRFNTGGELSDEFRLPNYKGKTIVGLDSTQTEFDAINKAGGAKTVTLTANQSGLRAHEHHRAFYNSGGAGTAAYLGAAGATNWQIAPDGNTGVYGGAQNALEAHNNLQPYGVARILIRAVTSVDLPIGTGIVHNHDSQYSILGHTHNAGDLSSGVVADARLPTRLQDTALDAKYARPLTRAAVVSINFNASNEATITFSGGGFPTACDGVVVMQHGTYNAPYGPIGPFMVRNINKTSCIIRGAVGNLNGVGISYIATGY